MEQGTPAPQSGWNVRGRAALRCHAAHQRLQHHQHDQRSPSVWTSNSSGSKQAWARTARRRWSSDSRTMRGTSSSYVFLRSVCENAMFLTVGPTEPGGPHRRGQPDLPTPPLADQAPQGVERRQQPRRRGVQESDAGVSGVSMDTGEAERNLGLRAPPLCKFMTYCIVLHRSIMCF